MKKSQFALASRSLFAAAASAFLALSVPVHLSAKPPEPITGSVDIKTGFTSVVLSEEFESALTELGVSTRKIIPGQYVRGQDTYRFPIRGGVFDLNTTVGEVIHSGGVHLSTETVSISLTDFILSLPVVPEPEEPTVEEPPLEPEPEPEPAPAPALSALVTVNGQLLGRVALFSVDLGVSGLAKPHTLPKNKKLGLDHLTLTLTAEGAEALNTAFEVTSFVEGAAAGEASVKSSTSKRPL